MFQHLEAAQVIADQIGDSFICYLISRATGRYNVDQHIEEMFYVYGRAVFSANVFEWRLVLAILQIEFLKNAQKEMIRTKGKSFDQQKFKRDLRIFLKDQSKKPVGKLIERLHKFPEFDQKLKKRIGNAAMQRNTLVHRFWRDSMLTAVSREGRDKIIEKIEAISASLDEVDSEVEATPVSYTHLTLPTNREV